MRLGFNICALLLLGVLVHASLAQDSPLKMKPNNIVSFHNENVSRVYNRLSHLRGNIALSPDSKFFLGSLNGTTAYLRNLSNGELKRIPVSHKIAYALFSQDSKRVAVFEDVGNRKTITVLNLELGKVLTVVRSPERIDQISISPDGERIATSRAEVKLLQKETNVVNLWNANDGRLIARIEGCARYNKEPVFSSDSHFLLLDCEKVNNKPTKVIDAKAGVEISSLWKKERLGSYEFVSDFTPESSISPDSKTGVSIVRFSGIRIWDIASGHIKQEFKASQGDVMWITFTRDGRSFATNGRSPVIRLWDTETGEHRQRFVSEITKSPAFMVKAKISPDGTTLTGIDTRGRITVWEMQTGKSRFTLDESRNKGDWSGNAFYGSGGRVLFVYTDKTIKVVEIRTGKIVGEVPNASGLHYFDERGNTFFTQDANGISVWSLN